MTVLSLIQEAAPFIGLEIPDAVMSSTDRTSIELKAVVNDMADKIGRAHKWQKFSAIATITGDGTTTDWDLPTDYGWMPDGNELWSSTLSAPLNHIVDLNEWLGALVLGTDFALNSWIIYGDQVHIRAAVESADTVKYFYQNNLIIAPASGSNKAAFTLDTDTFRLPERLLKLGLIYRWKQLKGQPYAEEMNDFEDLKEKLIARDKGATILKQGSARAGRGVSVAYPGSVPTS